MAKKDKKQVPLWVSGIGLVAGIFILSTQAVRLISSENPITDKMGIILGLIGAGIYLGAYYLKK